LPVPKRANMKNKNLLLTIAVILAVIVLLVILPKYVHGYVTTPRHTILGGVISGEASTSLNFTVSQKPTLTPAQIIWLARLMNCESGIKETAVNPNDLDNTPSWGILQFKDTTFAAFTKRYGIEAELMNAEAQVAIVTEWLLRPGEVDFTIQFPACVSKLGLPPVQSTSSW
jgi:hypothetical protein